MQYKIEQSFRINRMYSGPAGRIIDEDLYKLAHANGFGDRVSVVGDTPISFRTTADLEEQMAEIGAELELRKQAEAAVQDVDFEAKDDSTKDVEESEKEVAIPAETSDQKEAPAKNTKSKK